MTKTEKRTEWLKTKKEEIEAAIRRPREENKKGGTNCFSLKGWSGGGYGYWLWAFSEAGIACPSRNYWSGSAPTPSTAIPFAVSEILWKAPENLK